MTQTTAHEILALAKKAHDLTESAYQRDDSAIGEGGWNRKQRFLLADMAIHLLQTALRDGDLDTARLRTNLYSVLTVSAQIIPDDHLKHIAESILPSNTSGSGA